MTIYISESERKFLLSNFNQMKQMLSTEQVKCINQHFDPNNEKSQLPLASRLLAPGIRTIAKFKDQPTSRDSVQKIVDVYNSLFMPATDINTFLSVDVFEKDHPRKIYRPTSDFFIGEYDCFYLSDNFQNEVHGGILKIFEVAGQYQCYLIMGLFEENHFEKISSEVFGKVTDLADIAQVRQRFNTYRSKLPDVPEFQNFSLSAGSVRVLDRSVLIDVRNVNNPNHITVSTLGTTHNKNMLQFPGGLAVYLSPATDDLHTRVCKMIVVRSADVLDSLFEQLFSGPDENSFWMRTLQMTPTEYGRIEILDEDINKRIQSEIRKLNR